MTKGIIKWFNRTKGYGFIESDDGESNEDVFIHITVLEKAGVRYMEEGTRVIYEAEIKNERLRAITIEEDQSTGKVGISCDAIVAA